MESNSTDFGFPNNSNSTKSDIKLSSKTTPHIKLTIDDVVVYESNSDNMINNTNDYTKSISKQDPPNNRLIEDKEYKHRDSYNKETKLGKFLTYIITNRSEHSTYHQKNFKYYKLNIYFDNDIFFSYESETEKTIDDFYNSNYSFKGFLDQIYFLNKKTDSKLKYYNFKSKLLNLKGGKLSRKTNKKSKKNSKSKKTKFNRNKK